MCAPLGATRTRRHTRHKAMTTSTERNASINSKIQKYQLLDAGTVFGGGKRIGAGEGHGDRTECNRGPGQPDGAPCEVICNTAA